ncbi:two-component system response regulator YesN [Paenibacillus endophyticus]|uniref:Two-component system response regulator YesN n=1 Tax=Paenibacillus endophyticus TaxID=1294268 RepID=A0A7W5CCS3_9BACL|nr:response regulator [Paenibacillus endophyticus]MBB3155358.1 two-component system response regulator YesN [Paenibacillus endophyticus]
MVKLLIVEDNDFERNALQNYMDWDIMGIRHVETAFNGLDGLEKAKTFMPDIIISDVMMPGMGGIEMAKNISRFNPQVKFIFSSGHEDVSLLQEAIEVRAYSYLIKPLKQVELISIIKKTTSILVDEKLSSLENNKIIEQFRNNLHYLQTKFLEELIVTGKSDNVTKSMFVQANDLQLSMIGMYKLALIEFDFGAGTDIFHNSELFNVALYKLESICNHRNVIFIKKSGKGIIVLLHTLIKGNEEGARSLHDIESEIKVLSIENKYNYIIGVSDLFANLDELNIAYKQISFAVSKKMKLGYGQIVYYSDCKDSLPAVFETEQKDLKSEITQLIDRVCDGENCDGNLSALVHSIVLDPSNKMDHIQSVFIVLFSQLSTRLSGMGESFEKMAEEDTVIYKNIINAQTIPDMIQYTGKLLASVSSYMDRKKLNKDDYTINEILHILNHEYKEPITLTYLSDRVYLSPNYLRIIFKEKMKISIQEYLTNLRICKAKELLKETRYKVHEIGKLVGYENSTYFNIVFKNYMKMTPGEYRNKSI